MLRSYSACIACHEGTTTLPKMRTANMQCRLLRLIMPYCHAATLQIACLYRSPIADSLHLALRIAPVFASTYLGSPKLCMWSLSIVSHSTLLLPNLRFSIVLDNLRDNLRGGAGGCGSLGTAILKTASVAR